MSGVKNSLIFNASNRGYNHRMCGYGLGPVVHKSVHNMSVSPRYGLTAHSMAYAGKAGPCRAVRCGWELAGPKLGLV